MKLEEAFRMLPKKVSSKAIRYIQEIPETLKEHTYTLQSECSSLQDALTCFKWSTTQGNKEGTDYWWEQYKKADGK